MNEEMQQTETQSPFMPMSGRQLLQVAVLGLIVGLAVWGMAFLLENYVFKAIMCRGAVSATCGMTSQYATAVATILAGGIGLFGLVRFQVFRPLLVVIAAGVAMWGIVGITAVLFPWYGVGIACALLYALSYLAFTWILRVRVFWIAVALLLVLIVAVRLLLMR
ncbi:MAG TPA: hypothetical protein VK502_02150 [Candidatus Saccharimonadales bacterium]|nr:hypothetical protein [Candidatus Saccharimonadales bacterium]